MAVPKFEYRKGERLLGKRPLDSTSADISDGRAITTAGATSGYFKEVDGAAEAVSGISVQTVASPSADGGADVLVDISPDSVYEVAPDSGTAAITNVGKTCDVGADGLTIDHDGSTTDDILIVGVDLDANTYLVQLRPSAAGVA